MNIPDIETPAVRPPPEVILGQSMFIDPPMTRAVQILNPPKADEKIRLRNNPSRSTISTRPRRTTVPTQDFAGTLISYLQVSLGGKRIAFCTDTGPPIRGYVDTELQPKLYLIKVNKTGRVWEFTSGTVEIGVRFGVKLDGTDPFQLNYPDTINLLVLRGLDNSNKDREVNFDAIKTSVIAAVASNEWRRGYEILNRLLEVDMYDIVDELWFDHSDIVRDLARHLVAAWDSKVDTDDIDFLDVLRCLESFTITNKSDLYIDHFVDYTLLRTPWDSRAKARVDQGLSNNRIMLTHGGGELAAMRCSIIWLDDILDNDQPDTGLPTYGSGALLYPKFANRMTTPRLHQAKKDTLRKIEEEALLSIIEQAKDASVQIITAVIFEAMSLWTVTRTLAARPRDMSPISSAYQTFKNAESGVWVHTGENMAEEAMEYEARVCMKDKGLSYVSKLNGKKWDGFDAASKKLIDAKYWSDGGKHGQALLRGNIPTADRIIEMARKDLVKAAGVPLQWRVFGKETAATLKVLFKNMNVDIEVIWVP